MKCFADQLWLEENKLVHGWFRSWTHCEPALSAASSRTCMHLFTDPKSGISPSKNIKYYAVSKMIGKSSNS